MMQIRKILEQHFGHPWIYCSAGKTPVWVDHVYGRLLQEDTLSNFKRYRFEKHKITGLVNPENPNEGYLVIAKLGLIYSVSNSNSVRYVHEGEVCRLMGPHARVIRTYYESRNLYNFVQR